MNLSFTDLFDSNLENQQSDREMQRSEDSEQSDYKRDETDEHYLSEYRNRNASEADEPPHETQQDDRFSSKGRFFDHDDHQRFDRDENG